MINRRGRQRHPDDEICPNCRTPGYRHPFSCWNPRYKNDSRRVYYKFIHSDRSLSPCYIRKQKECLSLQVGTEYYNNTNTVRRYLFDKNNHSLEQWKDTNAIDVFVYSFSRLPNGFKSKLKKLKRLRLRKKELKWIFEKEQCNYGYLKALSGNDIVTFGPEAEKIYQSIKSDSSWLGNIQIFSDKNGLLEEILHKRRRKEIRI
jgi:hypothetical protein